LLFEGNKHSFKLCFPVFSFFLFLLFVLHCSMETFVFCFLFVSMFVCLICLFVCPLFVLQCGGWGSIGEHLGGHWGGGVGGRLWGFIFVFFVVFWLFPAHFSWLLFI
jgi:hypothetical protein